VAALTSMNHARDTDQDEVNQVGPEVGPLPMRWKPALNAFAITFSDRFPAAETY
jgi:hypothetical protein